MQLNAGVRRLRNRAVRFVKTRLPVRSPAIASGAVAFEPGGSHESTLQTRKAIADIFIRGHGIEIGALHQPLPVPASATVRYVDRMPPAELRRQYEPIADQTFVEIDIIDDGEQLTKIGDRTQDFVIANHFIEHCQNPILMLQNTFRVLKPKGVLYLAVPDKRFTFDVDRPCTTIEHILRDFAEGPAWSKQQHFEEYIRLVHKCTDEAQAAKEVQHLLDIDYSIHFHVWGAAELLELIGAVQRVIQFELELFLRNGFETIVILRNPA